MKIKKLYKNIDKTKGDIRNIYKRKLFMPVYLTVNSTKTNNIKL